MPVATEIALLHLREGFNPEESGTSGAETLKKCAAAISSQPGWQRTYWGVQVENAKILVLSIDWDDVQDHKNYINSEAYKSLTTDLSEMCDFEAMAPVVYHVNFTSDSIAARETGVTEFAPFPLAANASSEDKSALEDKILQLAKFVSEQGKCSDYAFGWTLEELDNKNAADGKTKVLQAILGWPSVEDHVAATKEAKFADLVGPIRSSIVPRVEGQGVFHVKLHGKPKL